MENSSQKISDFMSLAIVAIIINLVLLIVFTCSNCCISWQKVVLFSIGIIGLTILLIFLFHYFHAQNMISLQNQREKEHACAERLEYAVRKAVEMAKESQKEADVKKSLAAKIDDIRKQIDSLKTEYDSSVGGLSALKTSIDELSESIKALMS